MNKKLTDLLNNVKPLQVVGSLDTMITDVVCDSRQVSDGALFVAVRGVAVDAGDTGWCRRCAV